MTIQELYNKHKESIVAIYQTGSVCFDIESNHDKDYAIYFESTVDYEKVREDIEFFRREQEKRPDVFIHYTNEEHKPVIWSYQFQHWKLLHGNAVLGLYDILQHTEECINLTKKLVGIVTGKNWYHVYILAKVLSSGTHKLVEADKKIIADIYANGITDGHKALIMSMVSNLQ